MCTLPSTDSNLNWYKVMSKSQIFNLTSLQEPVLISTAHVGLPGDTVVYQYGFGKPQGPVSLGGNSIGIYRRFADHMLNYFSINLNKRLVRNILNLIGYFIQENFILDFRRIERSSYYKKGNQTNLKRARTAAFCNAVHSKHTWDGQIGRSQRT
jgi:hypothetical protein